MAPFMNQISGSRALTLIGMCKNAGKTTAMNHMIRGFAAQNRVLGLTSIGRDGEAVDRVTGTEKPGIFVRRGTLLATAAGLLSSGDITREILAATGIHTPLGEVVIARALSDGNVELAGPSIIDQLVTVRRMFEGFGAETVLIDGAISRKTPCSRALSEATVLSVGASCGRDMARVVQDTAHVCRLLSLPEVDDGRLIAALAARPDARTVIIGKGGEALYLEDRTTLQAALKAADDPELLFLDGALSEGLIGPLIRAGGILEGVTLVARDASRILITAESHHRLGLRGAQLRVLDAVGLRAVTVNPFSAYGHPFDGPEFLAAMTAAAPVPVYDLGRSG